MTRQNERDWDDGVPMTSGRGSRSASLVDNESFKALNPSSDLDRHLMHLVALHPALRERFGDVDSNQLDLQAKQELLNEFNRLLGIPN